MLNPRLEWREHEVSSGGERWREEVLTLVSDGHWQGQIVPVAHNVRQIRRAGVRVLEGDPDLSQLEDGPNEQEECSKPGHLLARWLDEEGNPTGFLSCAECSGIALEPDSAK